MTRKKPMLFIEFNELSPRLLTSLMEAGSLPHFARFAAESQTYVTDAGETDDRLQPWIAWPSVHSGRPYRDHGVYLLGEAEKLRGDLLGHCLADAGLRVGIFGSMNVPYERVNGFVFPDPWAPGGRAQPAALQPLYDLIAGQVQEAATHGKIGLSSGIALARTLVANGLTPRTACVIAAQLVGERASRGGTRWRRASVLDHLEYDVFARLVRRHDPDFASFFSNSTAHYQHYYWRNMEPSAFAAPADASDHASLRDAVPFGYRSMDAMLGRFMHDFPHHLLVLCTALSQHPHTARSGQGVRPTDFAALFRFAGVSLDADAVRPVMAEEFHVVCGTEERARETLARLEALRFAGAPLMVARREGTNVFAGAVWLPVPATGAHALLDEPIANGDGAERRLGELFGLLPGRRSGTHHPDGVLWIRTGVPRASDEHVPIERIAPSLLRYFDVAPPASMREAPLDVLAAV